MEKYERQRESSVKSIYSDDEYNELLDKIIEWYRNGLLLPQIKLMPNLILEDIEVFELNYLQPLDNFFFISDIRASLNTKRIVCRNTIFFVSAIIEGRLSLQYSNIPNNPNDKMLISINNYDISNGITSKLLQNLQNIRDLFVDTGFSIRIIHFVPKDNEAIGGRVLVNFCYATEFD